MSFLGVRMSGEIAPLLDGIKVVADAAMRDAIWPLATRPQNARVQRLDTGTFERWTSSIWQDLFFPVLPTDGRTVASLAAYLANNAVANVLDYGAIGNSVADDTAAFQLAMAAPGPLLLPKKTFKVSGATVLTMTAGKVIISQGATILHSTTTGTTINVPDGVNDWSILGQLTIVGAGNAAGTAKQLALSGSVRYHAENLTFRDASGWGLFVAPGTYVAPGGQGQFSSILCYNCFVGAEGQAGTGAEYLTIGQFNALSCTLALSIASGNWQINGGNIIRNVDGVLINNGANHAHGQLVGMAISHNTGFNVKFLNVTNGHTMTGCHIYGDDATHGYILMTGSYGINIMGGTIDAPLTVTSGGGYNKIQGAFLPGTYFVVTDPSMVCQIADCFTSAAGILSTKNFFAIDVTAPTLINSWVNFGGSSKAAGYWKDRNGTVRLEGMVKSGTSGTVAFVLPVGFRPSGLLIMPVVSNDLFGFIQIATTGNVTLTGSTTYVSLEGISFRVT